VSTVFRHADGRAYGSEVNPTSAAAYADAFRALRGLGFGEGEARKALEQVRQSAHVGETRVGELIRAALGVFAAAPALF
jgi:Holliday junction resolvasome RuvABC DNA-binding subunit